jgi:hypothetical protein
MGLARTATRRRDTAGAPDHPSFHVTIPIHGTVDLAADSTY